MKRIILLLLLCFSVPTLAEPVYTGHYTLSMSGDSGWHRHGLMLERFGDPVKGALSLDLSIGPQARIPQPHERIHIVPFEVAFEGEAIVIDYTVAGKSYNFQLYPLVVEGEPYLGGFVTITSEGDSASRTAGVVAVKNIDLAE